MIVRYAVGVGLGAFILLLLVGQRGEFSGALRHLDHLNYAWASGAVLAEVLSIVGYGFLQQRVLQWSGAEISLRSLTLVSLANNAIAYSVPASRRCRAPIGTGSFDVTVRAGPAPGGRS